MHMDANIPYILKHETILSLCIIGHEKKGTRVSSWKSLFFYSPTLPEIYLLSQKWVISNKNVYVKWQHITYCKKIFLTGSVILGLSYVPLITKKMSLFILLFWIYISRAKARCFLLQIELVTNKSLKYSKLA